MKKIAIYMIGLASLVGLSGCLDDKNDYNYSVINSLVGGEIKNMNDNYNLASAEELTISPTFEFTIDKENPDVSYEWMLDGKLLPGENGPSCTFSFERSGSYEITYLVTDNKSGVKFTKSCVIVVRSPFTRGWLILSEGDSQESVLSFLGARTVKYPVQVIDSKTGNLIEETRDSLVYGDQIIRNVLPGLGSHPKGMFLNAGYVSAYGEVYEVSDEVVIMQDRWAELNGTTLERSVYTDEEFRGDFPAAGFKPVSIAMTYSAKAMLNEDGYIYWANNSYANDFHTCAYISEPLGNKQQFTGIYPSYKVNKDCAAIPACTADNKIVGLMDDSYARDGNPFISESSLSGNIYEVKTSEGVEDTRFNLGNKKIVAMMPATWGIPGYQEAKPDWVTMLKEGSTYQLLYFGWKVSTRSASPGISVNSDRYSLLNLPQLTGYTDMAVFNNKQYVVIANGSDLWYFQYGVGGLATMQKLHTFDKPIKALCANDARMKKTNQSEHMGQLGVVLSDGSFLIYAVVRQMSQVDDVAICTKATIKQLFPDPNASTPVDNKFGKVVDMIYKYGNVMEFCTFDF